MSLIPALEARRGEMLAALEALVTAESPTSDVEACERCLKTASDIGAGLFGEPGQELTSDGRAHLSWRFGTEARVLLLGHLDTVWPIGTTARWPFAVDGDVATGPGVLDMKAGVVQLLFALTAASGMDGVEVLLTTDEEIGSPTAHGLIEERAAGVEAVLVLEPSAQGALKTARKGVGVFRVEIAGRAAHAGLEPEKGVNAAVELAHQILAIEALGDVDAGTTVTPSVVSAGTASNTVPHRAVMDVDVRAATVAEFERIRRSLGSLTPRLSDAVISVTAGPSVLPMERKTSAALYALANEVAADLGIGPLEQATVGGGSDGNRTAGLGIPTLDGLGAIGDGAHAEGEWVSIPAMAERAALVAGLVDRLRRG